MLRAASTGFLKVSPGYEDVVANSAFNPEENVHAELVFDARSKGR